jgi:hypothetical protein
METVILKSFFRTFFSEVPIADQEFLKIQHFLFDRDVQSSSFLDERLLMVVEGLKEVVEENSFYSIEDLHRYYENKVRQVRTFLKEIEIESNQGTVDESFPRSIHSRTLRNIFVSWSASSVKRSALPLERNEYLHCMKSYYEHSVVETLRNKFVDCHSFRFNLQGSCRIDSKVSDKCEIDNRETRLSWTRYFEGFSNKYDKGIVLLLGKNDDLEYNCQFHDYSCALESKLLKPQNHLSVLFDSIMQKIGKEVSIFNATFKEELAIWLSFSKSISYIDKSDHPSKLKSYYLDVYNNSRSFYNESSKSPPIDIDMRLYYSLLALKHWVILKSPDGNSWLTSDNPGFSINPERINVGVIGFKMDPTWQDIKPDSVVYYPLSSKYCLKLQSASNENINSALPTKDMIQFEESTDEELQIVNGLTFSTKNRMVVAGDSKPLEQFEMI